MALRVHKKIEESLQLAIYTFFQAFYNKIQYYIFDYENSGPTA